MKTKDNLNGIFDFQVEAIMNRTIKQKRKIVNK